jgi:hypothetical protein
MDLRVRIVRVVEQDRPDVAGKRRRWRAWQRDMDPARFVFLDETDTATNRARRYGRSPSARRLVAQLEAALVREATHV